MRSLFTLNVLFNLPIKTRRNYICAPVEKISIKLLLLLRLRNLISSFCIKSNRQLKTFIYVFFPILPPTFRKTFLLIKRTRSSYRFSNKALIIFQKKIGETLVLVESVRGILPLNVILEKKLGGVLYGLFY